jgi:hypothetical protein
VTDGSLSACSTPEGIEAMIATSLPTEVAADPCSTPEGIEAVSESSSRAVGGPWRPGSAS